MGSFSFIYQLRNKYLFFFFFILFIFFSKDKTDISIFNELNRHNTICYDEISKIHVIRAMRKCVLCYMRTTKAQMCSLISAFVVRCLDSIISLDSIAEISLL